MEAFDGDKRIAVVTSTDAIDDFGLPAVQTKASQKYDAKAFDEAGPGKVFAIDF